MSLCQSRSLLTRILPAALLLLLGACSSMPETDHTAGWGPEEYYQEARDAISNENYEQALNWFSQLESRYPYGRYAQQAQIETIYLHYKLGDSVSAVAAANRFIKLHPRHPNVDYAYYLRALASSKRELSMVENAVGFKSDRRDVTSLREAFGYFRELVTRFPDSRYSEDSVKRMGAIRNELARYELMVAEQYLARGAYLAVVNRAKYVLEHYPRSSAIGDALVLMVRGYRGLEMTELAADTLKVLRANHPEHPALAELEK